MTSLGVRRQGPYFRQASTGAQILAPMKPWHKSGLVIVVRGRTLYRLENPPGIHATYGINMGTRP